MPCWDGMSLRILGLSGKRDVERGTVRRGRVLLGASSDSNGLRLRASLGGSYTTRMERRVGIRGVGWRCSQKLRGGWLRR